jgi:transposase
MPKALNPQQKATVTTMLAAKAPQREIAAAASCSVSQIKRMAKNIRKWGKPQAPKLVPQGRPRALAQEVVEVVSLFPDRV